MEPTINEKPLSPVECTRLKELETTIRDNFIAYVAVGQALLEIRESRLYRTEDGRTWEGYCRELWDMSHQRADQLIAAKSVIDNLTTIVVKADGTPDWDRLPANEAQARELARLAPEEQREVWQTLIDESGEEAEGEAPKVTAKAVKNAVKALKGNTLSQATAKAKGERTSRKSADANRESEAFKLAWVELMEQIEAEQRAGWKHTSREVVFNALLRLAMAAGDCGEQTMREKKIAFRRQNLEKLVAAGWKVLRRSGNKQNIEQLGDDGTWVLYGEYETVEQCDEALSDALVEPNSIQA